MLGYGLVNSAIHEICLSQIITSFLSRSSVFLANYYFATYLKLENNLLGEEEKDNIVNLFLEEEKYIEIQKNKKSPNPNFNEEEIIYKYLLSANVISNKDYNFDIKTIEEIIKDGKNSLKNIFIKILKKFVSDFIQNIGGVTKIPVFEEPASANEDFLLNLIKYSTFIFVNNSVSRWNGSIDYIEKKASSPTPDLNSGNPNFGITQEAKNELNMACQKDGYFKTFYCPPSNIKYDVGDKKVLNVEYNEPPLENNFYNYFTTGGKFFNYGKSKDKKIDPIIFGEFYYTVKPEKINEFFQMSFTGPGLFEKIFEQSVQQLNIQKDYLFKDFQYCFHSIPYFGPDGDISVNQKNFLYLRKLGYFDNFIENDPTTWKETEKIEKSTYGNGLFTLSRKEIFKYYKFSFTEIKNIADVLKQEKKKFEDYFDLNFRINLNLTADLDLSDIDFDNHHIYELFNIPYKDLKDGDPNLSKYPPFFRNKLFNQPTLKEGNTSRENIIYNKFEFHDNLIKPKEEELNLLSELALSLTNPALLVGVLALETIQAIYGTDIKYFNIKSLLPILYSNLLKSYLPLGNKPEDNVLFKMLFGKEGITITIDEYSKESVLNKFKINYFKKIVDFKIDTKNEGIYFSNINDAKDALYLIKNKYYKSILSKLYDIYASSEDNNLKRILDSYAFDKIKEDLEGQFSSVKKPEYIEEYEKSIKDIYQFYEEIKITKEDIYNVLITRETAINILDSQIKVLENG